MKRRSNFSIGGTGSGGSTTTAGFALLQTITDNLVPISTSKNYDFDLSAAQYKDSLVRLRAEFYGTTKDTGGVPGPNLTGVTYGASDAVFENTNGSVSVASAAAGGAANPMANNAAEFPRDPCSCDAALRSGGGSTVNAVWSLNGTFARLTLTTTNNANRGSYEIDIYQRLKVAP